MYKKILEIFNKQGVQYCVLRNYEFLLDKKLPIESELDISISKSSLPKAISVLRYNGFKERGWNFSEKHIMFINENYCFDMQIDGVYWNDMPYLDSAIYWFKNKKDYFFVLCDEHRLVMYICHSILGKRMFKDKYKEMIKILMNKRLTWDLVNKHLYDAFGKKNTEEILDNLKQNMFIYRIRYSFKFIMKWPHKFIKNSVRWLWWKCTH